MIQTYKLKHEQDFSKELELAEKIAWIGFYSKTISSKDVKHIGLKSMIANQILKKYSRNKKLKSVKSVKLAIPSQGIKIKDDKIYIPCLKLSLEIWFDKNYEKINQIEIGKEYAYISVSYREPELIKPETFIGVDRNTTHHTLVASDIKSGKIELVVADNGSKDGSAGKIKASEFISFLKDFKQFVNEFFDTYKETEFFYFNKVTWPM